MRLFQYLVFSLLVSLLVSCGGGGGGGASSSGNSISLSRKSLSLVVGSSNSDLTKQTVQVTFHGAGVVVGTLPGQVLPGWLTVIAGTTSGNLVSVDIGVDANASGLSSGNYAFTLRFATGNADRTDVVYQDLLVTLTVAPIVAPATVGADAVVGGPLVQTPIVVFANSLSWVARTSAPWITIDRSSGVGTTNFSVIFDPSGMTAGDHTGTVTVEDTVSHVTKVVPVTLSVDPHRLVVRRPGVALSLVGSQSRLSSTIMISDNGHMSTQWSANSDQSWVQLDKSEGNTDGALTLTADASGLSDGLHYARVTILPKNEPTVSSPVVVRVGLYVDRATTFVAKVSALARKPSPYPLYWVSAFIGDPIRPYFYHSQGDGQIDIYNAYTAILVGSIPIPGAALGAMVTSLDGSMLFVADQAQGKMYPVDLDTRTVGMPFAATRVLRMAYTEVNGRAALVTNEFQVIDAKDGMVLADAKSTVDSTMGTPQLVAQRDGRAVYFQGSSNGNHDLARYSLSYRNGVMRFEKTRQVNERGDGSGLALSFDDSRLYTSSLHALLDGGAGLTGGYGYDAASLAEVGRFGTTTNWATDIATSPNNSVFVSIWEPASVATYQPDFSQTGTYSYGQHIDGLGLGGLSGDARRLGLYVGIGIDSILQFIDVP